MKTTSLIMAAGKGERFKSKTHKTLNKICGKALIDYITDALEGIHDGPPIVVVSHEKQQVIDHFGERAIIIEQDPALGWGTAIPVKSARGLLEQAGGIVLVCTGDTPHISAESFRQMKALVEQGADAAVLTVDFDNPYKYGRIIRDERGNISDIVEEKDCDDRQRLIKEINTGLICFRVQALLSVIDDIKNDNAKGEYYLTDTIRLLSQRGGVVKAYKTLDESEGQGVNDQADLAASAAIIRKKINHAHMLNGVQIIDPEAVYIDHSVNIGPGTVIYPGCVIEGETVIGEDVLLKPGCHIVDSVIKSGVSAESSLIVCAQIGEGTSVGPNAYIRPDTIIGKNCRIGDFVELKNAKIGDGSKVAHLSYVGDAVLGRNVNTGCGVVFVNYDGKNKHVSTVGDRAFLGSNCNIIAPLAIGDDAYIAAGSTITCDVPAGALFISRARERTVKEGWVSQRREKGLL
ncbi:MAG: bifunctional UDP-N-acetylglucosamine diphosphorylase/glucosamine-1-phosphate N-acetyltransferase GlmU [Christensenellales bacterium]|jgi:bifunctional UDP-N-acetylglucosamine pyrophosphorylase/glucosamine-1-phosphate N-acetyltransferase